MRLSTFGKPGRHRLVLNRLARNLQLTRSNTCCNLQAMYYAQKLDYVNETDINDYKTGVRAVA